MKQSLRVLLVEDSPGDARLFEEEARDGGLEGLDVVHASRIDEALRLYEPGTFDLVLLDLNLPDAKGLRSVERVTAAVRSTPVVVLTTLADEDLALQAIASGAEEYLVKGEHESWQLVRVLRHAVARRRRPSAEQPSSNLAPLDAATELGVRAEWLGPAVIPSDMWEVRADLEGEMADLIALSRGTETEAAGRFPARARDLAQRLSLLAATPRDVVEINETATGNLLMGSAWGAARADGSASRRVLMTVLSYLCLIYRGQKPAPGAQAVT